MELKGTYYSEGILRGPTLSQPLDGRRPLRWISYGIIGGDLMLDEFPERFGVLQAKWWFREDHWCLWMILPKDQYEPIEGWLKIGKNYKGFFRGRLATRFYKMNLTEDREDWDPLCAVMFIYFYENTHRRPEDYY